MYAGKVESNGMHCGTCYLMVMGFLISVLCWPCSIILVVITFLDA